jgi:outer membrane biosynthesis protein TonB
VERIRPPPYVGTNVSKVQRAMKVICDNCRAVYKIPDEKLIKPVNKATCTKCGHRMLIPRPRAGANPDEKTLVTSVPPTPAPAPGRQRTPTVDVIIPPAPLLDEPETAEEEPEQTMPGIAPAPPPPRPNPHLADDVPLFAETPKPAERRGMTPDFTPTASPVRSVTPSSVQRSHTPPGASRRPIDPTQTHGAAESFAQHTMPPVRPPRHDGGTPAPAAARPVTDAAPPARGTPAPSSREARPSLSLPEVGTPAALMPAGGAKREDPPTEWQPREQKRQPEPQNVISPAAEHRPTPQPAPRSPSRSDASRPGIAFHDPSSDLALAAIGVSGALLGVAVMAIAIGTLPESIPVANKVLTGLGTLLATGGGISALMVILTGGRGTRPARPIVSVIVAGGMSTFLAGAVVGLFFARDQLFHGATDAPTPPIASPTPSPTPTPPTAEPTPAEATPSTPDAASAPVAPTVAPPKPEPTPKPDATKPTAKAEPAKPPTKPEIDDIDLLADDPPKPGPKPAVVTRVEEPKPEPKSNLPSSVPDDVIDTLLRNNVEIKRCFYNYSKESELPPRVTVGFMLENTGKIRDVAVVDADLKGSSLDTCLARAVGNITMPQSTAAPRRIKYPFQLQ